MDGVGGQVTATLNMSRLTSHLRNIEFFSKMFDFYLERIVRQHQTCSMAI